MKDTVRNATRSARIWWFLAILLFSNSALGQDLQFENISDSDLEKIVEDFSGNFMHTSVSGASTLGSIFGFEVGVVAGAAKSENIESIVKETDPTADVPFIPHGGLLGILTVPFGLTVEATLIPEIGDDDFKFQNLSAALKWTPTETLLSALPLSLAGKVHFSKTTVDFKQNDPGTSSQVDATYENSTMGVQILASKNLIFVEPYAGVGFLKGDGELTVKGTNPAFDFTSSQTASKDVSGANFFAGAEFKLLIFKGALEYSNQLGVDSYTAKFSLYF